MAWRKAFSLNMNRRTRNDKYLTGSNPTGGQTDKTTDLDEIVAADSMSNSKRQLYKFDLPSNEQGFDDLLKDYKEGNRFQYIALSGKTEESYAARIRRLVTLSAKTGKEVLPMTKIPIIKLIEETEQFNLGMIVPKKGKPYIRLASVSGIYVPLVSALSDFTTVKFSLHDTRLLRDTCVQSVSYNSNLSQKVELSLDYCIPRGSASKVTLNIHREQAFLVDGEEWGTVQLQIRLEESDFPYSNNLKDVTSIMALPPAVLETHSTNPNHIDSTLTERQRRRIREMYENGDIADENEPITEQVSAVTYVKSSIAPKVKGVKSGVKFGGEWSHVDNFHKPLLPDDQISKDPEDSITSSPIDLELFEEVKRNTPSSSKVKGVQFAEKDI